MTGALVLAGTLAIVSVVWVALPFLREPVPASDSLDALDAATRRRLELAEARDRALETLREVESDHRAGLLSDEEYRAAVGPLRREAAQALRALDAEKERPGGA